MRRSLMPAMLAVMLAGAMVLALGLAKPDLVDSLQLAQALTEAIAAVLCVRAARHTSGRARMTWSLFAVGLAIWSATDLAFGVQAISRGAPDGLSIFDAFWLAFYLPMLIGVGIIYTAMRSERGWQGLIDAALVAIATAVFGWVFWIEPMLSDGTDGLGVFVDVSYAALDVAAIATVGWLMVRLGKESPPWLRFVCVAFALQVIADLSYLAGSFVGGDITAFSAAAYTVAGGIWAIAGYLRLTQPGGVWKSPSRSAPPLWSQITPACLGLALVAVASSNQGAGVTIAAVTGAVLMTVRLLSSLLLDRTLMQERQQLAAIRTRLLGEERHAREVAEAAKDALVSRNEQLIRLDRMKDEFVGMVSHEFRTPLTSIHNYVYSISAEEVGPLTTDQVRFLGVVQRNTERLSRLVEDLLLFAKIKDSTFRLNLGDIDVGDVLRESVQSAMPHADQEGVHLHLECLHLVRGRWDGDRLGQVFDNLISNAIKFTPSGGHVDVALHVSDEAVVVDVADTGPGISIDEIEQLFTPFFRTRHATESAVPGTGLGLAISRSIVEAHGGAISARRGPECGTVFRLALPRHSAMADLAIPNQEVVA